MNTETNTNTNASNETTTAADATPMVVPGAKRARAKWMTFGGLLGAAAGVAGTLAFQAYKSGAGTAVSATTEG